jgi:hypothetical protein
VATRRTRRGSQNTGRVDRGRGVTERRLGGTPFGAERASKRQGTWRLAPASGHTHILGLMA